MPDSSLIPFDRGLADLCKFNVLNKGEIKFQFPPRILSESNNSEWESKDAVAIEPIKIHRGSGGRKLSMEWEYLATDQSWTAKDVAKELKNLKRYFFDFELTKYPVCEISYTEVIPELIQFRLMSADITYSPEIVNSGGFYHPIHTKIAVSLELVTRISPGANPGGDKVKQKPLKNAEFEWY